MSRCDLSRAPLPFIESHDTSKVNIGIAESLRAEGDKLRCDVRLGNSARAKELADDIKSGVVTGVSIGYQITDPIEEGEREGLPVIRFAFTPHEISAVSVPADINAGFYRSKDSKMETTENRARQDAGEAEKNRVDAIRAIADKHDLGGLGMRAIAEKWTIEQFNEKAVDEIGRRNEAARSETRTFHAAPDFQPAHAAGMPCDSNAYGRALEHYSVVRLLRGLGDPKALAEAGLEVEISQDMQRTLGRKSKGIMVPWEALHTRDVTVSGTGSNMVATQLLAGRFIDLLRNKSHVMKLNPTILTGLVGDMEVPRQTGTSTAYWIEGDGADSLTESDPTFDNMSLTPKVVGGATTFSHKLLVQATPNIEDLVRSDLAAMIAVEIDHKAINGTGLSNQPTGILNTSGINTQSFTAADPTYEELVGMETAISDDNAEVERMAYLTTPAMVEHFKTTPKQGSGVEGNFIWDEGAVNGYRCLATKNVATGKVILGDWEQLFIGFWGGIEIDADPYGTNFLAGSVTVRVLADVDFGVRHPEAFCVGSN